MCMSGQCKNEDKNGDCKLIKEPPSIENGCYIEIGFLEEQNSEPKDGMCDFDKNKICDCCEKCAVYPDDVATGFRTNYDGT